MVPEGAFSSPPQAAQKDRDETEKEARASASTRGSGDQLAVPSTLASKDRLKPAAFPLESLTNFTKAKLSDVSTGGGRALPQCRPSRCPAGAALVRTCPDLDGSFSDPRRSAVVYLKH